MTLEEFLEEHSQSWLADQLEITQGAISQWLTKGRIPAERVIDVEKATGGSVSRYEMRPDIYPPEVA